MAKGHSDHSNKDRDRKRHNHHHNSSSSSSHSASPAPAASTSASASASIETPPTKKGRYERNPNLADLVTAPSGTGASVLVSRALKGATRDDSPAKTNSAPSTPASVRAQFEQQEDFISFGEADEEEEETPRSTPRGGGGSNSKKRAYNDSNGWEEDHRDESTKKLAKREKERTTPWCDDPGVDWKSCDSAISMLNHEARAFITYISPTVPEHDLRLWTVELIRRAIKTRFTDAEVECFGSVGTGLYLPGGDIDLVVLSPSFPSPPLKPNNALLHHLASLLLNSSLAEPSSLIVIAKARVPIVKFTTRYGGFSVDLSVNQKNGVEAAVRVRNLLETFAFRSDNYVEPGAPSADKKGKGKQVELDAEEGEVAPAAVDYGVARSLVMLVKAFLNQRGMNEVFTGGLGSYSIICLVVSFLQVHPKIQTGEILPERNIGLLFLEFLEYYGKHFNYNEAGITLRGRGGYFNKHDKGWFRPNQPFLLSIEDPNDPQNDVSGGTHNIIRVRQTLAGAFDVLTATLYQRESHFRAIRDSNVTPLSSTALPNSDSKASRTPLSQSVLGSVIGMSQAAIVGREANVRLYESGMLQDLLRGSVVSKNRQKKLRKKEKEAEKRQKTIARLEMKMEQAEEKQERKKNKKNKEKEVAVAAPKAAVEEIILDDSDEDEQPASAPPQKQKDEEDWIDLGEDSRYSIGSPAPTKEKSKGKGKLEEVLYVHGTDSEDQSDSDDDESDEDDMIIGGGTGGDTLVRLGKKAGSRGKTASEDSDSSDGSGEEVVMNLVPARDTRDDKRKKKEERNAFWNAKGVKDLEGFEWDD